MSNLYFLQRSSFSGNFYRFSGHLVFNFERLTFLDSSGIGLIIGRYQQLKVIGGDVTICNLNDKIERIIRISGLMKICKIRDNEESVLMFVGAR